LNANHYSNTTITDAKPSITTEIDAKTLYPGRFQYSQFQLLTRYSGFDETSWFLYCVKKA